jgi:hypothetical protein
MVLYGWRDEAWERAADNARAFVKDLKRVGGLG